MKKYFVHVYWNGLESPTEFDITEDIKEDLEDWVEEAQEATAEDYLIHITADLLKSSKDEQDLEFIGWKPVRKSQIRMVKYEIREISND